MAKRILIMGGTRFFGKHLVQSLLASTDAEIVIATRGQTKDDFGTNVRRVIFDRTDEESIRRTFANQSFDVVYDNIAYSSYEADIFLSNVAVEKYIVTSSMSVYDPLHMNTVEADFDPSVPTYRLVKAAEVNYAEGKRELERIVTQKYADVQAMFVRFPFVLGPDDYTKRLTFYVEHCVQETAMAIDNLNSQMGFIQSDEAGRFLAHLRNTSCTGPINAAAKGTASLKDMIQYVEHQTGKQMMVDKKADRGPYNGAPDYSINVEKAEKTGFSFSALDSWLYNLIDYEIAQALEHKQ